MSELLLIQIKKVLALDDIKSEDVILARTTTQREFAPHLCVGVDDENIYLAIRSRNNSTIPAILKYDAVKNNTSVEDGSVVFTRMSYELIFNDEGQYSKLNRLLEGKQL